jgi:hypothetical protein
LNSLFLTCERGADRSQVDIDKNILNDKPVNVRKLLEYFEGNFIISDQKLAIHLECLLNDSIVFRAEAYLEEILKIVLDYLV